MKKHILIALLVSIFSITSAQSNRLVSENGEFLWQYHRSAAWSPGSDSLMVTFVFVNGNEQRAICFRQECFWSALTWRNIEGGITSTDKKVAVIQANLAPNQAISWSFTLNDTIKHELPLLEKAAILMIDEEYNASKERINEISWQ